MECYKKLLQEQNFSFIENTNLTEVYFNICAINFFSHLINQLHN